MAEVGTVICGLGEVLRQPREWEHKWRQRRFNLMEHPPLCASNS
ncbi:MAG TPA: hypothetical protein VEV17_24885 [Bryobacteraceae bacterium]|nr:hypothetical protein [Bryobacteraceae bacterium]